METFQKISKFRRYLTNLVFVVKSQMSAREMAGCWFEARGQNQSADVDYQREILSTSSLSL